MRRVTGIGGIFLTARYSNAVREWYGTRLGIDIQPGGGTAFSWTAANRNPVQETTAWSVGPEAGNKMELWEPPRGQ